MARIVVATDTLAALTAEAEHRFRIIDDEAGMHFDGDLHAVIGGELATLRPVGNRFLFPVS